MKVTLALNFSVGPHESFQFVGSIVISLSQMRFGSQSQSLLKFKFTKGRQTKLNLDEKKEFLSHISVQICLQSDFH